MAGLSEIEATFRIVTPMFLGGADQEAGRLRESSFKGALTFWWRALHFSRMVAASGGDTQKALVELKKRERALFGSADKFDGQSKVIITVRPPKLPILAAGTVLADGKGNAYELLDKDRRRYLHEGAAYFGYGVVNTVGANAGKLARSCIKPGEQFNARLLFHPRIDDGARKEVIDAVKLLGLVGGLGSRVRRGYGSLALVELKGKSVEWQPVRDKDDYVARLKALLGPALVTSGRTYPLAAFAAGTRTDVTNWDEDDPLIVLDKLGRGMQRYRSWGYNGRVHGKPSEKIFEDDHDWIKKVGKFSKGRGEYVSERAAFGLPHAGFNRHNRDRVTVAGPGKIDRRASPLFFHVHRTVDDKCFGVVSLFGNRFLPDDKVSVDGRDLSYKWNAGTLTGFLDDSGKPGHTGPARFLDGNTIIP